MKKNFLVSLLAIYFVVFCVACEENENNTSGIERNNSKKVDKSNEMNNFLESNKELILFINYAENRFIIGILEEEQLTITVFDGENEKKIASIKTNEQNFYYQDSIKLYKSGFVIEKGKFEKIPYLIVYDYDLNEKYKIDLNLIFDNGYSPAYSISNDLNRIAYLKYDEDETYKSYLIIKEISSNTILDTIDINPKSVDDLTSLSQFSFSEDNKYIYYSGFSLKEVKEVIGYDSVEHSLSYGIIDLDSHTINNIVLKEISFFSNSSSAIIGFNSDEPKHTTARNHIFVMINGKIEEILTNGMESEFIQMAGEGNAFILVDKVHEESTNSYTTYTQRLFVDNKEVLTIIPKDFGVDGDVNYRDVVNVAIDVNNKKLHYFYKSYSDNEIKRTDISFDGD